MLDEAYPPKSRAEHAIPGPELYGAHWEDLRIFDENRDPPVYFGSSDAAPLMGASKWATPLDVYAVRKGLTEPPDQTMRMKMGHKLESVVLEMCAEEKKLKIEVPGRVFFHPEIKPMLASPDGICMYGDEPCIVEAKTARMSDRRVYECDDSGHTWGIEPDGVPIEYVCQVNWQMEVMGYRHALIPVLFDRDMFCVYHLTYDEQLVQEMIKAMFDMLQRMKNNDPPPAQQFDERTAKTLSHVYGVDEGRVIQLNDEQVEIYENWQDAKAAESAAKQRAQMYRAQLEQIAGGAEVIQVPKYGVEIIRAYVPEKVWTQDEVNEIYEGKVKRRACYQFRVRKLRTRR